MKNFTKGLFGLSLLMLLLACSNNQNIQSVESFDSTDISQEISESISSNNKAIIPNQLYTDSGIVISFNTHGARIEKIMYGDKQIAKDGFIAGRCANRIANASFELNGITYNLDKNDSNKHHLHGGKSGFGEIDWTLESQTASTITYKLHSADGDMGYPGNLDISVTYTLHETGELNIEYRAKSDADTILNPINHLYMSLNGNNSAQNHTLMIDADSYTEKNNEKIPTGNITNVEGTKYDFREAKELPVDTSWFSNNNFDDNFCLNGTGYRKVAALKGNTTNIQVEVFTDRPGLQLYNTSTDICLEAQLYPDAIHHDNFASPILKANEDFYSKTSYCFTQL